MRARHAHSAMLCEFEARCQTYRYTWHFAADATASAVAGRNEVLLRFSGLFCCVSGPHLLLALAEFLEELDLAYYYRSITSGFRPFSQLGRSRTTLPVQQSRSLIIISPKKYKISKTIFLF